MIKIIKLFLTLIALRLELRIKEIEEVLESKYGGITIELPPDLQELIDNE